MNDSPSLKAAVTPGAGITPRYPHHSSRTERKGREHQMYLKDADGSWWTGWQTDSSLPFDDPSLGSQLCSIISTINLILQGNNVMYMIHDCVQQVNSVINSMLRLTPEHNFRLGVRNSGESFTSGGNHLCLGKNVQEVIDA